MFYSVDRVDDEYVMLCDDDGDTKVLRRFHFEGDVQPGQVYRLEAGRFVYDEPETAARRERIQALEEELFNNA